MTRPGKVPPARAGSFFSPNGTGVTWSCVPAAAEEGAQHRLVPEQGLYPQGGPGHPVA